MQEIELENTSAFSFWYFFSETDGLSQNRIFPNSTSFLKTRKHHSHTQLLTHTHTHTHTQTKNRMKHKQKKKDWYKDINKDSNIRMCSNTHIRDFFNNVVLRSFFEVKPLTMFYQNVVLSSFVILASLAITANSQNASLANATIQTWVNFKIKIFYRTKLKALHFYKNRR